MYDITGGNCEWCCNPNAELHHYPPRSQKGAKHDPDHLLALCRRCHNWADHHLPHNKQYYNFREWYDSLPVGKLNKSRNGEI